MNARAIQPNILRCNQRTVGTILRGRLDSEEAAQRARMLVEDISWLGVPLRLCWTGPTSREVWPYYVFKNHTAPPEVFRLSSGVICKAVGYGLDWGDLVTFSKAIKIARRLWGRYWTRAFRERMKHFNNHISTIEEIWWLGLWDAPRESNASARIVPLTGGAWTGNFKRKESSSIWRSSIVRTTGCGLLTRQATQTS